MTATVMPASAAMSSTEAASYPRSANRRSAASRIVRLRSAALRRRGLGLVRVALLEAIGDRRPPQVEEHLAWGQIVDAAAPHPASRCRLAAVRYPPGAAL